MSKNTSNLNYIGILLTFITVLGLPPAIIGGTMGINVIVPGQFDVVEELWPFWMLIGIILLLMTIVFFVFRKTLKSKKYM